jgi:hypothetical protein
MEPGENPLPAANDRRPVQQTDDAGRYPDQSTRSTAKQPGADLVPPHLLAAGVSPQQYADYAFRQARKMEISGFPAAGKTWQARGQAVLDSIKQAAEIPTEAKLAGREGMSVPEYQSVVKGQEAVGGAVGKRVGEVVEAGGLPARHTINTLDIMEDALNRAGRNITTGPGAAEFLRLKQAAQAWLPGDWSKGLTEAETIKKLNATLASQAAKAMTARPSQLEFKAFMANNPGLETSVQGTKTLISIMRQAAQQDIALGKLAMNPANLKNWSQVEDNFYRANPIQSPFAVTPKPENIARLKANPSEAKMFDEAFGPGSAAKVLR